MYTSINFPTKKLLKQAVAEGRRTTIYAPGLGTPVVNGIEYVEGPHYPAPHTWYAKVIMKDGNIIKVE